VNRLEHQRDLSGFTVGYGMKHIAVKMDYTALPLGMWIKFPQRLQ
jgi:hypothetical protein